VRSRKILNEDPQQGYAPGSNISSTPTSAFNIVSKKDSLDFLPPVRTVSAWQPLEQHVARLRILRILTNHQKERSHRPQVTNRMLRECHCFNRKMTLADDPPILPVSTVMNHAPIA
jgi:hypothetical protein